MDRSPWNLALGAIVLVIAQGCASSEPGRPLSEASGSASGYNVLLVTLDTTRADRIGCYGYADAVTPTLDRLAADGVRVADAVTVAPVTLPAHASILTGRYPPEHGVRDNGEFILAADETTLAERLSAAGYSTAAFIAAFVLDARFGLGQGFDLYDDAVNTTARSGGMVDHANERDAQEVTDAAIAWLDTADRETPFFAWVHYFDPHQPYAEVTDPRFAGRPYDAEIAHVDAELGRLLLHLETLGQRDRTLVVVVADHGEGLDDHDESTHSLLIYGSTMRVPLILNAPGALAPGQTLDGTVASVVDLVPTMLDLLGLEPAADLDGIRLAGPAGGPDRLVYMESLVPWLDHGWAPLHAVRRHHDKLILAPEREYFDLRQDPGESHNLYRDPGSRGASRDRLDAELVGMISEWPSPALVSAGIGALDPEVQARLESLGYSAGSDLSAAATLADTKAMMPLVHKLNAATNHAAAGRFDAALELIDGIADGIGQSRTLLGQLARIYVRLGREEEAVEVLERYLAIRPSTQALVMLAQIHAAQGALDDASSYLDLAIELDPRHGASYIVRGDIAVARGDAKAARAHYLEAREVDPYRATAAVRDRLTMLRARRGRRNP